MRLRALLKPRNLLIAVFGLLVLIQLVPVWLFQSNPPVVAEPAWDSPQTRALAQRACFDCHSNETIWPWYSRIAPASWLVQHDVDEGREALNFSEWDRPQKKANDSAKEIQEREMPPRTYLLAHPPARLSQRERGSLIAGLRATLNGTTEKETVLKERR